MYFGRALNKRGLRAGILVLSLEGAHALIPIKLDFEVTNNMAEYKACIIGMRAIIEIGVKKLWVYRDSSLIINQIA